MNEELKFYLEQIIEAAKKTRLIFYFLLLSSAIIFAFQMENRGFRLAQETRGNPPRHSGYGLKYPPRPSLWAALNVLRTPLLQQLKPKRFWFRQFTQAEMVCEFKGDAMLN